MGGRLVSAGGVRYSYNAEGVRCKKTAVGASNGEKMYLDGGKILGEDRADYKLRYFYDTTGLKRIHKIEKYKTYSYECVKDSQGSIVMLLNTESGGICCRYEYDALGKCTITDGTNDIANINPFRWKGFFYDSESGFYYANGSYYDPETGLYVDAAPVSTVFDNADSPRYIDRNGTLCYNPLELAGSPYTVFTVAEMSEDPLYSPGQTWWEKTWGIINNWWNRIPSHTKAVVGVVLILASLVIGFLPGGKAGLAFAISAVVQLVIGVSVTAVGWAINSAKTGKWDMNALGDSIAETLFFVGVCLFVESSISAIKYAFRSKTIIDGVRIQNAQQQDFTPEAWDRIQSLEHRADGSTISSLKDGRLIHDGFKTDFAGLGKELTKQGVGRFDYINMTEKIIYELKPNNAWSISRGIKQLHGYNAGMGGGYELILVLY